MILSFVTPRKRFPPLFPVYFGTHGGAYTVNVTWRTPGPHDTPLRATPFVPAAAGGVIDVPRPELTGPLATFDPSLPTAPGTLGPDGELPSMVPPVPWFCPAAMVPTGDLEGMSVARSSKTMRAPNNGV
jgi:hypothetical protein